MAIVLAIPLPKQTKETSWTFENDFCYYTDENKHFKLVCFNNFFMHNYFLAAYLQQNTCFSAFICLDKVKGIILTVVLEGSSPVHVCSGGNMLSL